MRIVYDYQIFLYQQYGGISRYCYELARRIAQIEGCHASIHALLHVNKYIKGDENFEVIGTPIPDILWLRRVPITINYLLGRRLARKCKPDIVHETYFTKYSIAPAKVKTVLTVYDMTYERLTNFFPSVQKISQNKECAVKRADHIVCISESTKNDLIDTININPDKISVIYLGYTKDTTRHENKLNINDKPYILYVGQRAGYKNFSRLLQAYAKSQRLQKDLRLVCFGADRFSNNEINQIRELNIKPENVVHLKGDDGILNHLYLNASIFVFPSLYEGFGIPLLEAMSFKCPVVCSNTSSFPEVAGDAADYFDPCNLEEMTSSIESVVFSTEKRNHLIERGLERIKLFSWEKCAEETMKVYSSLV